MKKRIFIYTLFLILVLFGLQIIINKLYFREFYINEKSKQLEKLSTEFSDSNESGITQKMQDISDTYGIGVNLVDITGQGAMKGQRGKGYGMGSSNSSILSYDSWSTLEIGEFQLKQVESSVANAQFLALYKKLDQSSGIVLVMAMGQIEDTIDTVNGFFVISLLIVLILGLIMSYYFSTRISKPIEKLSDMATDMVGLNFERFYEDDRNDEIGNLGKSLNNLSHKLSETLGQLEDRNLQLSEKLKANEKISRERYEFISTVAHEIKTPVSVILGYSQAISECVSDNRLDKISKYADTLSEETVVVERIMGDIAQYVKTSDIVKNEHEQVDVCGVFSNQLNRQIIVYEDLNIEIIRKLPHECFISADYKAVETISTNLVSNAFKHNSKNGFVRLIAVDLVDSILIRVENKSEELSKQELSSVFKAFYKASTGVDTGSGLGLAIVERLCEAYGYPYGVENINGGVAFWVEFKKITENKG